MHMLTGQLRLRGVNAAIPELTIHIYAVGPRQVPQSILDPDKWDMLMRTDWKGLDAHRIGSVLSNVSGAFQSSYDPKNLPRRQSPNLWLAVTGPDLAGVQTCERVLYVSCDIRGNAGPKESIVLHLEEHRLRTLGLLGGTPRTTRGVIASDMLARVEQTARQIAKPDLKGKPFSTFFNARQVKTGVKDATTGARPRQQSEVGLTISMLPSASENTQALALRKDKATGKLAISTSRPRATHPLSFDGIKRLRVKDRGPHDAAGQVRIDPKGGSFELYLAHVPDRLVLEDADTLPLWTPLSAETQGDT